MSNDVREQPELIALPAPVETVSPPSEPVTEAASQSTAPTQPKEQRVRRRVPAAVKGRAIVITSGKGGVGKTTVTANLGAALADAGKRVVVFDADVGLRNLDVVMGLENRVRLHALDVLEGRCELDEALVRDRVRRNLALLPAAQNRDKDEIEPDDMNDLVDELTDTFDLVLIDCPAGIEQGFRNAVAGAGEAIIVTTPEVSAVRDADRVAGLLPHDMPARLIINRVRPGLVRKGTMMSVDDKEVIVATNRGRSVVDMPGSPTGQALRRIAGRLLGEEIPIVDLTEKKDWFSGMLSKLRFSQSKAAKG
jgi:septum site-determining protein MinD